MDHTHSMQQPVVSAPRIIYCTVCGAPACGSFCSNCGSPLRSDPSAPSAEVYSADPADAEEDLLLDDELPPDFSVYTTIKKSKHTGLVVLSILACLSVVIMLTAIMVHIMLSSFNGINFNDSFYSAEIYRGGVSAEEYDHLKLGMTYAHISSIIGGDGEPIETGTDVHGDTYYIYGWPGEYGDTAAVFITFTNDVATEITVDGFLE